MYTINVNQINLIMYKKALIIKYALSVYWV